MAKNYASIYASVLDSSSLNQNVFIAKESVNGVMQAPTGSDFTFVLAGGGQNFTQPLESSAHRSGRHNNNTIKKKKALDWNYPTYVNIDTGVAAGASEIDTGVATLWESLLGYSSVDGTGYTFDSRNDPSITMTIFENGDMFGRQAYGCFVDACEASFPGDGEAQLNWSGFGVESFTVGISQSVVDNNGGNTVTVATGEGKRFPVGGMVMIVEADGSVSEIYLAYYEPETITGIDNPQTGLVGSFASTSMDTNICRSLTVSMTNNHEPVNYNFGTDGLSGSLFVPASRFEVSVSVDINMNKKTVGIYNDIQAFLPQDITIKLGDDTSRHLEIALPRVEFGVPSISVPESGSIPVTFEGMAYQTVLDAADEVRVFYK